MRVFTVVFLIFGFMASVSARVLEFVREYEYFASEYDSRVTARNNATEQMQAMLLREIGQVVIAEQRMETSSSHNQFIYQDYTEKITAITASMVKMEILNETWTGTRFHIRARIRVDPSEVSRRANEIMLNQNEMTALKKEKDEILQQVDRLNNEVTRLRTRMQNNENFLFGEISEYKTRVSQQLAQINRLTRMNEEMSARHKSETDAYKLTISQRDSLIESLNDRVSVLMAELRTAQNRPAQAAPQPQAAPVQADEPQNFIRITTTPAGALIYANDRYIGRTPFTYSNPPHGQVAVRVRLAGHKQHTWDVNYNGGRQFLRTTLERN